VARAFSDPGDVVAPLAKTDCGGNCPRSMSPRPHDPDVILEARQDAMPHNQRNVVR